MGVIFLKYISDAFEEQHAKLDADRKSGADSEDQDEYRAANIFWVPVEARWLKLKAEAADHRQDHRRRHARHQARQPYAQGRVTKGLRNPGSTSSGSAS